MNLADAIAADSQSGLHGVALETLTANAEIHFVRYVRRVLPLDGFVYYLAVEEMVVAGSLHRSLTKRQLEDETIAVNFVIFTTQQEVQPFNSIAPDTLWVGRHQAIKFAFSQQQSYFRQANLFHYRGEAVYPVMESQLVDASSGIDGTALIVSNSLPAWLALQTYGPIWLQPTNPGLVLYPSYAVPDNLRPPYGVVHIEPDNTDAMQAIPAWDATFTQTQLARDRVLITLYGLDNSAAQDFLALIINYSRDTDAIGLANTPTVRDHKRIQTELGLLAMKKTIEFEVNYTQQRINDLARQLLIEAFCNVIAVPAGEYFSEDFSNPVNSWAIPLT